MEQPTDKQIFDRAREDASSHEDAAGLFDDLILDKAFRMRDARDHRKYMRHLSECISNGELSGGLQHELDIPKCTCGLQEHLDMIDELLSTCK